MKNAITYVGIDAHKKDLFVAMLVGDQATPVTWQVPNEPNAVRRLVRQLERDAPGEVRCCYEAGPGGYALQRQLTTPRVRCQVIAPGLIPRKPGERVKTNRRDARKLVELLRAGLLTEVRPPTREAEAVRDLCRARDDAREDRQRCRHRLGKLLLRRGLHYHGRNWTRAHRQWIEHLDWTQPAERVVVDDYRLAIDQVEARLLEFDAQLTVVAQTDPYREPVGWLRCFRGIDTLTAMLILAELHDFRRFQAPRALMAYLGLVSGEDSTGEKHRRGRITRAGIWAGPPVAGRGGLALSEASRHWCRARPTPHRTTPAGHCDRGQGAAAVVSPLPATRGPAQARTQDRGRYRARVSGLPLGGAPTATEHVTGGGVTSEEGP